MTQINEKEGKTFAFRGFACYISGEKNSRGFLLPQRIIFINSHNPHKPFVFLLGRLQEQPPWPQA